MNDLKRWLDKHKLGQYANMLLEHDVDLEILPHLSDNDLGNLGISLGHRRKLLATLRKESLNANSDHPIDKSLHAAAMEPESDA